jgi:hypothetical protein
MLDPTCSWALVAEASLAPSVHNIQPTRWRLTPDGRVVVLEDPARRLAIGDPDGRDVAVSHGCGGRGLPPGGELREASRRTSPPAVRRVAILTPGRAAEPIPLAAFRHRSAAPIAAGSRLRPTREACARLAETCPDLVVVQASAQIADLAALYDDGQPALVPPRGPYRAELVSWMRLSRRHADWARDGLNAEAMEMSAFEAAGAGFVLRPACSRRWTRSALLDRWWPRRQWCGRLPRWRCSTGRSTSRRSRRAGASHRVWLAFTEAGLSASPMAVLADDETASASLKAEYGLT